MLNKIAAGLGKCTWEMLRPERDLKCALHIILPARYAFFLGGGGTIIMWPEVNIRKKLKYCSKICFEHSNTLILHST